VFPVRYELNLYTLFRRDADNTNISVRSGSKDIAVIRLNGGIDLLEPRFQKWRIKSNTKNT
jgi:hypothetical protein